MSLVLSNRAQNSCNLIIIMKCYTKQEYLRIHVHVRVELPCFCTSIRQQTCDARANGIAVFEGSAVRNKNCVIYSTSEGENNFKSYENQSESEAESAARSVNIYVSSNITSHIVVVLLFYVHGKQYRLSSVGQLT